MLLTVSHDMLANRVDTPLDCSSDLPLPIAVRQRLNLSVTEPLHQNFFTRFSVSPDSRAGQVPWWTASDESTKVLRLFEWWQVVRHAKNEGTVDPEAQFPRRL